jgi:hypothetical protein
MLRKPDSIPASDTIIADKLMEPFFITRSQTGGFTVYERVKKGDNNTEYIKTICYPSNFGSAIKAVATEMLNQEGKTYDLKSYLGSWKSIKDSLTSIME